MEIGCKKGHGQLRTMGETDDVVLGAVPSLNQYDMGEVSEKQNDAPSTDGEASLRTAAPSETLPTAPATAEAKRKAPKRQGRAAARGRRMGMHELEMMGDGGRWRDIA